MSEKVMLITSADRFGTFVSGKGVRIPRSPRCCDADDPVRPLIARLGRTGEEDAKPEDLPVGIYQQLRWEVGCSVAYSRKTGVIRS